MMRAFGISFAKAKARPNITIVGLATSECLNDELLKIKAYKNASLIVKSFMESNKFQLLKQHQSFGFFQGYSGIGYQLLRLAYPYTFPSTLQFD